MIELPSNLPADLAPLAWLVDSHLLWAWDIAALGAPLASHTSARLAKVQ